MLASTIYSYRDYDIIMTTCVSHFLSQIRIRVTASLHTTSPEVCPSVPVKK